MYRYIQLLSGVLLLIFLSACQGEAQPAQTKLIKEDTGKKIEINSGDQIVITLEGNPTTGYTWEAENLDTKILKPVGEPAYETSSSAIGASGIFTFTFQAIAKGETNLRLIYYRPFEQNIPPVDMFEVTVIVK